VFIFGFYVKCDFTRRVRKNSKEIFLESAPCRHTVENLVILHVNRPETKMQALSINRRRVGQNRGLA
jgi:hypothetical protein